MRGQHVGWLDWEAMTLIGLNLQCENIAVFNMHGTRKTIPSHIMQKCVYLHMQCCPARIQRDNTIKSGEIRKRKIEIITNS